MKKTLTFLEIFCLFIILFNLGSTIWSQKDLYFSRVYWQQFSTYKTVYLNSQYVNKHPKGWIPDETVNAYAGGAYIKGVPPELIAPDTPPLGRYLIGLSAVIFNNVNSITLFSAIVSLLGMFLVTKQILKNTIFALLPPMLFSFEPLFKNQLIYTPLLDIMQLMFLLFAFFLFNKSYTAKKKWLFYILTSIFIGLFIATKFFITGSTIIGACFLVLIFHKQIKNAFLFLCTTPIAVFILLLTYIKALFVVHSLKAFVGIQKWIFLYHKSQLILPFSIWPLLLFNKWYVWYGNKPIISDGQWMITWPILVIITFITIVLYIFKKIKQNKAVDVLLLWSVLYVLFFSFGQITTRYFVIFIPILYIISIFGLVEISKKIYAHST